MINKHAMYITLVAYCLISLSENVHASDNEVDCGIQFSKSAAPSQELINAIESQEPAEAQYDEQRDLYYLVDSDNDFKNNALNSDQGIESSPSPAQSNTLLEAGHQHEALEFFYDPDRRKYYYISDNLVDDEEK